MAKESIAPNGMFEFSKPQPKKSDLFEWEAWFKSKKIKTKIVKNTNGMFVLCREGISS